MFDKIRRALFGPTEAEKRSAETFGYDLHDPLDLGPMYGDVEPNAVRGAQGLPPADPEAHEHVIDVSGDVPTFDELVASGMPPEVAEAFAKLFAAGGPEGFVPPWTDDAEHDDDEDDEPEACECGVDHERPSFSELDVDRLAHDLAQVHGEKMLSSYDWTLPSNEDDRERFQRVARFVLGHIMGLTSERDGEHTMSRDCAACTAVYGPPGSWADQGAHEHGEDVSEASTEPEWIEKARGLAPGEIGVTGDDVSGSDGPFSGEVLLGPPGSDPTTWKQVGFVTESGFVPAEGVELPEGAAEKIEANLFRTLGRKPRKLDDELARLLGQSPESEVEAAVEPVFVPGRSPEPDRGRELVSVGVLSGQRFVYGMGIPGPKLGGHTPEGRESDVPGWTRVHGMGLAYQWDAADGWPNTLDKFGPFRYARPGEFD